MHMHHTIVFEPCE